MCKKVIDIVGITPQKANAQQLTCFVAFAVSAVAAVAVLVIACLLPIICEPVAVICWISMVLEATSVCLGYIAYWIKRKAL